MYWPVGWQGIVFPVYVRHMEKNGGALVQQLSVSSKLAYLQSENGHLGHKKKNNLVYIEFI